jgi:hypothetical protein
MVMQVGTPNNKDKGLQGGQYARTEEELYKKALALLEKCRIAPGAFGPGDTGVGVRHLMPFASVPTHRHEPPVGGLL